MNRFFASVALLVALALVACDQQTKTEENTDQAASSQASQQEVADKLDGLWISDPYLKGIEDSKSIYKNRKYSTKMLGFYLNKSNLATDSAYLDGFSAHERGYSSPLKFESSGKFVNDLTRLPEMPAFPDAFELNQAATDKLEMHFPKTKSTDSYRKVNADLQTELRQLLIAGDYTDSVSKQSVQLGADGKVQGFRNFKYYDMIYDFEENIEYDAIVFFDSPKGGNWVDGKIYKFERQGNNLRLQYVQTNWETMNHKMSNEIHTLVKK